MNSFFASLRCLDKAQHKLAQGKLLTNVFSIQTCPVLIAIGIAFGGIEGKRHGGIIRAKTQRSRAICHCERLTMIAPGAKQSHPQCFKKEKDTDFTNYTDLCLLNHINFTDWFFASEKFEVQNYFNTDLFEGMWHGDFFSKFDGWAESKFGGWAPCPERDAPSEVEGKSKWSRSHKMKRKTQSSTSAPFRQAQCGGSGGSSMRRGQCPGFLLNSLHVWSLYSLAKRSQNLVASSSLSHRTTHKKDNPQNFENQSKIPIFVTDKTSTFITQ